MRPGFTEIMVVLVLVLLVFGPHRLPEIARQIGRVIREVRKVSGEFEREVRAGLNLDEDYGGNFPTWKGPQRPPMDHADPYRPPPPPPPSPPAGSSGPDVPEGIEPPGDTGTEAPAAPTDDPQANPPA